MTINSYTRHTQHVDNPERAIWLRFTRQPSDVVRIECVRRSSGKVAWYLDLSLDEAAAVRSAMWNVEHSNLAPLG